MRGTQLPTQRVASCRQHQHQLASTLAWISAFSLYAASRAARSLASLEFTCGGWVGQRRVWRAAQQLARSSTQQPLAGLAQMRRRRATPWGGLLPCSHGARLPTHHGTYLSKHVLQAARAVAGGRQLHGLAHPPVRLVPCVQPILQKAVRRRRGLGR